MSGIRRHVASSWIELFQHLHMGAYERILDIGKDILDGYFQHNIPPFYIELGVNPTSPVLSIDLGPMFSRHFMAEMIEASDYASRLDFLIAQSCQRVTMDAAEIKALALGSGDLMSRAARLTLAQRAIVHSVNATAGVLVSCAARTDGEQRVYPAAEIYAEFLIDGGVGFFAFSAPIQREGTALYIDYSRQNTFRGSRDILGSDADQHFRRFGGSCYLITP